MYRHVIEWFRENNLIMPTKSSATMVYQPPLTPVSEAESDATETASTSNTTASSATSSTSERSYFNSRPLNFSRPRPVDFSPGNRVYHDRSDSFSTQGAAASVHSFEAFDSNRHSTLPLTPNFLFDDSTEKEVVPDAVEFPWDEHLKDMRPTKRYIDREAPRTQPRHLYRPTGQYDGDVAASQPQIGVYRSKSASAPEVVVPQRVSSTRADLPQDVHKTSTTKEVPEEDWDGEDVRSHHTVSENGDIAEMSDSLWSSSSYDVSQTLGEKEIKKLRKKGINPALYAEMKAARSRRGKFGVNILSGNAYLS